MGGTSEREYRNKLRKIKEKASKAERNIRDSFERIEKIKVEALRKNEEMRRSAYNDIDKTERTISKSKDLAPESKNRLISEIMILRREVASKNSELKTKIADTMIPAYTKPINL
jgi:hypothetical protein